MKRQANKAILDAMQYLRANPDKSVFIPALVLEFQRLFGFDKRRLLKLLEPYVEAGQLTVNGNEIKAIIPKEVEQNGSNDRPAGQPVDSNTGTKS